MSDEYIISFDGKKQSEDVFEILKKSEHLSRVEKEFLEFKKNKFDEDSKYNLRVYIHGDDLLISLYYDFDFFYNVILSAIGDRLYTCRLEGDDIDDAIPLRKAFRL
ncbi:hypothetical protein RNI52_27800 [Labrys neptuniae]|uniref:hypothetical protein n=1 Tax=Labrys neptuniae TaxID=376174 RepID=UPI0028921D4C|nr:hypothetical protein [Labrys neptuniae]MDT3381162.1 hypothetical protein [Labrys neptuniae]